MKKALATAALSLPLAFAQAKEQTNVVFILIDDLGYSDLNFIGEKKLNTPNIDLLRSQGMYFDNAYAACPVSSPTRASIITGQYPADYNLTCHIPASSVDAYREKISAGKKLKDADFIDELPLNSPSIAKVMSEKGYTTASIGKWHMTGKVGKETLHFADSYGFDLNVAGGSDAKSQLYKSPYNNVKLPPNKDYTDYLGDDAVAYIKETKDKPFFLYLSFYAVHLPYRVTKEALAENDNNKYHAYIQKMDENVGKVMNCLKEQALEDNTLLIFYSDNGGEQSNAPLSGKKGELREGGIRVPVICRWPGHIEPGSTNSTPITTIDLMPTLQDLVGSKMYKCYGESFLPLLTGKKSRLKERAIFWHFPHHRKGSEWSMGAAVRKGDWKLIELYETDEVKLFNLKDDIKESKDLSKTHKAKTKELLSELHAWQKQVNAIMPEKN
ncbi:MAG: sulfatase [Rikenellaceae bacterium]